MRIPLDHRPGKLRADGVSPELPPGNEELLLRGEAVNRRNRRLAALRDLKCAIRDSGARQIADAFAEHEPAVVVDSWFDEIAVELPGNARGPRPKLLEILIGPPVVQTALGVVLRSLVVEPVADLVADDDTDGAVIDGIVRFHAECRRLEDAGWKHDLVE